MVINHDNEILERYANRVAIKATFDRVVNPRTSVNDIDDVRARIKAKFLREHVLCQDCRGTGITKVTHARCCACSGTGVVKI
jgi:hypothetical protein